MDTVNGREVGKLYTATYKLVKAEKGHSLAERRSATDHLWRENVTYVCQCGRKFSGKSTGPMYRFMAHQRAEGATK